MSTPTSQFFVDPNPTLGRFVRHNTPEGVTAACVVRADDTTVTLWSIDPDTGVADFKDVPRDGTAGEAGSWAPAGSTDRGWRTYPDQDPWVGRKVLVKTNPTLLRRPWTEDEAATRLALGQPAEEILRTSPILGTHYEVLVGVVLRVTDVDTLPEGVDPGVATTRVLVFYPDGRTYIQNLLSVKSTALLEPWTCAPGNQPMASRDVGWFAHDLADETQHSLLGRAALIWSRSTKDPQVGLVLKTARQMDLDPRRQNSPEFWGGNCDLLYVMQSLEDQKELGWKNAVGFRYSEAPAPYSWTYTDVLHPGDAFAKFTFDLTAGGAAL